MSSDVTALNTYIIAIPARIIVVGVMVFLREISTMAIVGTKESRIALNVMLRSYPETGTMLIPSMMKIAAPSDAPDATPVV